MRKLMKLMTTITIISTATFQVIACQNNSQYESFTKDIEDTEKNQTAFLGFLGSADNDESVNLYNIFDYLNKTKGQDNWELWTNNHRREITAAGLKDITLNAYQGPSHDPAPSDPITAFWTDKNITWQKDIFNWIYSRVKEPNPEFKTPTIPEGVPMAEIKTQKDTDENDMFTVLPIIFIVKKGKLITAVQNWFPKNSSSNDRVIQKNAIEDFILNNLLSI